MKRYGMSCEYDAQGAWVKWDDAQAEIERLEDRIHATEAEARILPFGGRAVAEAWNAAYWAAKELDFRDREGECARDGVVRFMRELHAKAQRVEAAERELASAWASGFAVGAKGLADAKREIAIDDELLAERNRLLDMLKCPVHGQCVPFAQEEIKRLKEYAALGQRLAPGTILGVSELGRETVREMREAQERPTDSRGQGTSRIVPGERAGQ